MTDEPARRMGAAAATVIFGASGPAEADRLLAEVGRRWRTPVQAATDKASTA